MSAMETRSLATQRPLRVHSLHRPVDTARRMEGHTEREQAELA